MPGCESPPIKGESFADGRTPDALAHCLNVSKPELVLIDEERVEILGQIAKGLQKEVGPVRSLRIYDPPADSARFSAGRQSLISLPRSGATYR
jgi:hypothetical protein